ncbi:S41 family peptidase [Alteribacter natronophilus]|uniref:S41 family peptidase n=1 Tax=Alteribacter natronophilus TaxID=2583810 RepID=UPI00110E26C3|nr:S41 family peptidase [Alteribacter natronophilus]TMW71688.1 hypothetical protein FGB90_11715 [Alteribacter natronophilus]
MFKRVTGAAVLLTLTACTALDEEAAEEITDMEPEDEHHYETGIGRILSLAGENRAGDPADDFNVDDYLYDYSEAEDEELSKEELENIRLSGDAPMSAEPDQFIEDLHYFHSVLKYQYALYGANGGDEAFEQARDQAIEEIEKKYAPGETISPSIMEETIREHYSFIRDTHFTVNGSLVTPKDHRLYMNGDILFYKTEEGRYIHTGTGETLKHINGDRSVEDYLLPSLSEDGEFVYIPGHFSDQEPEKDLEITMDETVKEVGLSWTSASYTTGESGVDTSGEIPVFALKDFFFYEDSDVTAEGLMKEAEMFEDEPYWILDLTSNPGGYPEFAIDWHRQHFGISPGFGDYMLYLYSNTGYAVYEETEEYYRSRGVVEDPFWSQIGGYRGFIMPLEEPRWTRMYSAYRRAENEDSVIFVITDEYTASAAEFMTQVMKHVDNTIIIGTSTAGALNSGGALLWELPNTNLVMSVPSAFNYHPENLAQEGIGLEPDLWLHPGDAVSRIEALVSREKEEENEVR